ncbi:MAG: PHP domain-containing protein [Oscillospiraceae bacterium]|nr:PHP domain-containing protein [Oscillospiraceae bacterium]
MYNYKLETHLHTSEGSACGQNTGAEMVRGAKAAGYSGVVVTDHFFNGNCAVRKNIDWRKKTELFALGYKNAKREGDKIGIDVYFGLEYGLQSNDFLIYNFSAEKIIGYPEIMTDSFDEVSKKIRGEGGFITHAHPFRRESYILYPGRVFPELTDAVETFNAAHNNTEYDKLALEYAEEYNLYKLGGSDTHSADFFAGGIAFENRPGSMEAIISLIKQNEYIILGENSR